MPYRRTKSAAHRIGDVPCPSCNPKGEPSDAVASELPCAWCWDDAEKVHRRYVKLTRALEWQKEHEEEYEIPTSPESRSALAPTEPAPPPEKETPRKD